MESIARDGFIGAELGFDASKHKLGSLCPKQHEFQSTGQTLRRAKSGVCVQCGLVQAEATKQRRRQVQHSIPELFGTEACPRYDTERFYLGTLCRRSHEWGSTGMSLRGRVKSVGDCIECRNSKEADRRSKRKQVRLSQFDGDHFLGDLCIRSHNHEETDKSLRSVATGMCVACSREKSREYCKEWKSSLKEVELIDGKYYLGDLCVKKHEHEATGQSLRLGSTKGCVECLKMIEANRRSRKNEYRKTQRKRFAQNNPEKARLNYRINSHKRRALLKGVLRQTYSKQDLSKKLDLFNCKCAYCCVDLDDKYTWDHVIPIAKGGSDAIDNLVPACSDCNLNKNAKNPLEWYEKQSFFSKDRWNFIESLLTLKPVRGYHQPSLLDLL